MSFQIQPNIKHKTKALPEAHDYSVALGRALIKALVLFSYHFVLIVKLEVMTIIKGVLHKLNNLVLIKIHLTNIAIILLVVNIVCTMLTI